MGKLQRQEACPAKLGEIADGAAYDVVVVGAGGAGMAAALFSALEGQTVLLVERTKLLGGTTAFAAATTWIPASQHAASVGAEEDTPEKAAEFLRRTVGNHSSEAMRQAFLRHGPAAIARLEAETEVRFRARPLHPDYIQEAPGATLFGRALEPLPFDGRQLGAAALALVRPPIPEFTVLGGMMVDKDDIPHLLAMTKSWASFRHSAKLLGRYALDRLRHGRGTRLLMGNALIGRLLASLLARGVDILVDTKVEALERGEEGASRASCSRRGARAGGSPRAAAWSWRPAASTGTRSGGRRCSTPPPPSTAPPRRATPARCTTSRSPPAPATARRRAGQRFLGAGLGPQARRWQHRRVPAPRAGPRQAGDGGGEQGRAPLRQRVPPPTICSCRRCTRRTRRCRASPLS